MRHLRAVCAFCGHDGDGEDRHHFWDYPDRTAHPSVVWVSSSRFRCGRCALDNPFWSYDVAQKALTMNIYDASTGKPWAIELRHLVKGEDGHGGTDPGEDSQ